LNKPPVSTHINTDGKNTPRWAPITETKTRADNKDKLNIHLNQELIQNDHANLDDYIKTAIILNNV